MAAARIRAFIKAQPRAIQIVNARELSGFAAGAMVFDGVAEIHADTMARAQEQSASAEEWLAEIGGQ